MQKAGAPGGRSQGCTTRLAYLQVPVHHPHLVAVQHGLQDLLDAVTGEREGGSRLRGKATWEAHRSQLGPAPSTPPTACIWHSPGICLTVILPGHDVFKQLPTSDSGETGTESLSHRGPRYRPA